MPNPQLQPRRGFPANSSVGQLAAVLCLLPAVLFAQTNYIPFKSLAGPPQECTLPEGQLAEGDDNYLYGTTVGEGGSGAIYKTSIDGRTFTVLKRLGDQDGHGPSSGLLLATDHRLYGATERAGTNAGTVGGTLFSLRQDGSDFRVLHHFPASTNDGAQPMACPLEATDGALYGTTGYGGKTNQANPYGMGVVFTINKDGTGYNILHSFAGAPSGDGRNPYASLAEASNGVLHGVTLWGGSNDCGTIFAIKKDGSDYTVLHSFRGCITTADGREPHAEPVEGPDGFLYGTTEFGGVADAGTIYKIDKGGSNYITLRNFLGPTAADGADPWWRLLKATNGVLYGSTTHGGIEDLGTVFSIAQDGTYTVLRQLQGASLPDGRYPYSPICQAHDGTLYGATLQGGTYGVGTVFLLITLPKSWFTGGQASEGHVTLLARAAAGASFQLQSSDEISPPNWSPAETNSSDTIGFLAFTNLPTSSPCRFFRLTAPAPSSP